MTIWTPTSKEHALALAGGENYSTRRTSVQKKAERLSKWVEKGSHFLDFGCGPGRFFPFWEQYLINKGATVWACDTDQEMLNYCECPAIKTVLIENDKLPFRDDSIDFIFSNAVLIHVDLTTICRLFKEFNRVLKTNGIMMHDILLSNPTTVKRVIANRSKDGSFPPLFSYTSLEIEEICRYNRLEHISKPFQKDHPEKRSTLYFWKKGVTIWPRPSPIC